MDLKTLQEVWQPKRADQQETARALWNQRADQFRQKPLPTLEENAFLRLMAEKVPLTAQTTALDIGCGTGIYSLALAQRIQRAVGCDISDRMVEIANRNAAAHALSNASFFCADWETADISRLGLCGTFDIVFAHMTPAVNSYNTLEHMVACAKQHCFLKKPTRRRDLILDQIMELLGLRSKGQGADDAMEYLFSYLWRKGYEPQFQYEHSVWQEEKSVDDAFSWGIGWASMQREISQSDRKRVRSFLEDNAIDGKIHEQTVTTAVTLDWAV